MEPQYLTVIIFSGGSRLLKKTYIEDSILMRHNYNMRIRSIFPTAVIHTVEHFEIKSLGKKIYKPVNDNKYKPVIEDI